MLPMCTSMPVLLAVCVLSGDACAVVMDSGMEAHQEVSVTCGMSEDTALDYHTHLTRLGGLVEAASSLSPDAQRTIVADLPPGVLELQDALDDARNELADVDETVERMEVALEDAKDEAAGFQAALARERELTSDLRQRLSQHESDEIGTEQNVASSVRRRPIRACRMAMHVCVNCLKSSLLHVRWLMSSHCETCTCTYTLHTCVVRASYVYVRTAVFGP